MKYQARRTAEPDVATVQRQSADRVPSRQPAHQEGSVVSEREIKNLDLPVANAAIGVIGIA
jgi:hypothetical protein